MSTVTASQTSTTRGAPRRGGGYGRPSAAAGNSRFEVASWFFMRLSGLALIFLVLYHLIWWNLVIGVEHLDAGVVIERWQNPWWRFFNFAMVSLALLHGWNGARYVIEDYVRRPGWQLAVKTLVYAVIGVTLAMGIWALVVFDPAAYFAR
jgi:succinate dehydrogenase / fumarate reductase, membrane anchor subunit